MLDIPGAVSVAAEPPITARTPADMTSKKIKIDDVPDLDTDDAVEADIVEPDAVEAEVVDPDLADADLPIDDVAEAPVAAVAAPVRKSIGMKEVPPFLWKLVGTSGDLRVTLFKNAEREEVDAQLERLTREGYYRDLEILAIDAPVEQHKPAAAARARNPEAEKAAAPAKGKSGGKKAPAPREEKVNFVKGLPGGSEKPAKPTKGGKKKSAAGGKAVAKKAAADKKPVAAKKPAAKAEKPAAKAEKSAPKAEKPAAKAGKAAKPQAPAKPKAAAKAKPAAKKSKK
jgi:hypothetical protein